MFYKQMRQTYITKLKIWLEESVEDGIITEEQADIIFKRTLQDWECGYGDYMYDSIGDR